LRVYLTYYTRQLAVVPIGATVGDCRQGGEGIHKTMIVALMLACGTAQASEWVSVGTSEGGKKEHLVDASSIRVDGQIRHAWFKIRYAPHTQKGVAEYASVWETDSEFRDSFNCAEETSRNEALNVHFEDGTTWVNPPERYPAAWEPVPPDTMIELVMMFVCAKRV
jgi:hypothetical protein